ncbi:AraC family transcriptional regulator [Sphingobacterium paludis]|uniref:AraC family transcriptional regulator n=1 Tax=Sphingobacterium paludis TaxID=1476465 RepID=A0A4R7DAP6_9SPHI|nr:AraC family transcriptional regulator [Sphingobacterium paludis]TDS17492.1 AraC family transcriptional regulator [Sphingobacterium paludis]
MTDLFKIYRIELKDVVHIDPSTNNIHHHDFEELIIGIRGEATHFIDYESATYSTPFAIFVAKGKMHRIQPLAVDGECDFWVIRFRSEFIPETTFTLYAAYHNNANIPMQQNRCFDRLLTLCELMDSEMKQVNPDLGIVKSLLSALFVMIESERKKQMPETDALISNQNITFQNFLSILEENFRRPEGVNYYAEKLFMSARNLNLICHRIMQQSVSEIIETRKLIEAKNLLMTSDKPVATIGYELGYTDKAHFSHIFKKKSGQTPTAFRKEIKRLLS